jgi:hypothetical protein
MKASLVNFGRAGAVVLVFLAASVAGAQQGKSKTDLTGRYEGSAKNASGEVITVTLDLAEKEGAVSGTISSSHGDFPITSGSHQGKTVTLQFDAQGTSGTIAMELSEDKLAGTWKAGDDGGPVDVKKVAVGQGTDKGKS